MKLSSDVGAARDAVSRFADVDLDGDGRQASLGSSNVSSIRDGAIVANRLIGCLGELIEGVKRQADNVTSLATEIQERDSRDGGSWGAKP